MILGAGRLRRADEANQQASSHRDPAHAEGAFSMHGYFLTKQDWTMVIETRAQDGGTYLGKRGGQRRQLGESRHKSQLAHDM
jgi:hypothetical protein